MLVASTLAFSPPAAAQTQPFTDTSSDSYYSDAVAALADIGIFDGTECAEGMLCPEASIDRKTMAVWTVRALDDQGPTQASGDRFTDVDANSFHAPFIERMAELGVTSGCGDGTEFCPDATVTRAQMAVFLTRAFNLDPGPDPGFTDVAADAWYYDHAAALAASGITAGCGDGTAFCPKRDTSRAQMATFLARALGLLEATTATTGGADVTVGVGFACAVIADGTMDCWGRIGGEGSYILSLEAARATPGGSYVEVSATYPDAACALHALRSDGTLECWSEGPHSGENRPDGVADTTSFVVDDGSNVPGGIFKSLDGSCAIRSDDSIECWGHEPLVSGVPQGTFKSLSSGWYHACGVRTEGTLVCWGQRPEHLPFDYGLGLESDVPQGTFTSVAVGFDHACAIRAEGTLACWGQNPEYPGLVSRAPQGTFTSVALGGVESCAIRTDATLACWGSAPDFMGIEVSSPQGAFTAVAMYRGLSFLGSEYISDAAGIMSDGTVSLWGSAYWDCCG